MRTVRLAGAVTVGALVALGVSAPAQAALRAPSLQSPAKSASVEALPTFTWGSVKGAAQYEFQVSDDAKFQSIVSGGRSGGSRTKNTAATFQKSVPDGNYFWRVRAISSKDKAGRWSSTRSFTKAWKTAPLPLGPSDDQSVAWPSLPLLLRWTPVPHAVKYLVTIATDPTLAQPVAATNRRPVELPGTAFALQGTLPVGRYYWAVTPVDADGLRGTRSRVAAFTWTWPTATTASVADANGTAQVFDPLLSWGLIPGAARYEVEINPDDDFSAGSRVCCKDSFIATSVAPLRNLPNNNDVGGTGGYHWRVRAFDIEGNPGQWNRGPVFVKGFDDVTPTVPGLRLSDASGALTPSAATTTSGPIVAWDPVPGAAQYQLQWAVHNGSTCNWSAVNGALKTSNVVWTPLSPTAPTGVPGGLQTSVRSGQPYSGESAFGGLSQFANGVTYCLRVRARSDDAASENEGNGQVISQWTQLGGGGNQPAFTYQAVPSSSGPTIVPEAPPSYLSPAPGAQVTRTPLLRWNSVAGATRYFVMIARDSNFTNIVDVAFTAMTSYAPNLALEDEVTSYFWAVIPTAKTNGSDISGGPTSFNPQSFNKLSTPPSLLEPVGGPTISTQPTFRWLATDGARVYRLQVSADPQFGDLLENVVTASTAYVSNRPYPVDTILYWRVRAEQLDVTSGDNVELRWSESGTFRRTLPAPALSGDIPLSGELPPVLTWSAVPGALSYDIHIDEADGDANDFNVASAAGTFTRFFGLGTFKYKVRANFASSSGTVASAYSAPRDFTRVLSPPDGRRVTRSKGRLYFGWNSAAAAKSYKVEVSTTDSFSRTVESVTTNNTSWAPSLSSDAYRGSGPLYWRVASVDDGGNVGAYVAAAVRNTKPLSVRVRGSLRRNRTARLIVTVRASGKALRSATVRASGAGLRRTTKRTTARGAATLRLRPTRKGMVAITVSRSGYTTKTVRVRVR